LDLKEEDILGDAIHEHWYYVSKGRAMRQVLGRIRTNEVLDVGAGSGIFSRQLLDHGVADSAICLDPLYPEERTHSHNGRPIAFVRNVDIVRQNLVLMMDVLEHVDDDVGLLRRYAPQGHVLITVPAFPFLWSGHDVFLEHRRRYTRSMLEDTVRKAGLEVVRLLFFFGALFPAVAAVRLVKNTLRRQGVVEAKSELSLYPSWLNKALIAVHDVERNTLFPVNRLAGLSLFCLCKK
jgi:hypothetical protein